MTKRSLQMRSSPFCSTVVVRSITDDATSARVKPLFTNGRALRGYVLVVWIAMHLVAFLNTGGGRGIQLVFLFDILMLPIVIDGMRYLLYVKSKPMIDWWVILYMTCNVISVHTLLLPGCLTNVSAIAYGIHAIVVPLFIYFCVRGYLTISYEPLLARILWINMMYVVYGLYVQFLSPYAFQLDPARFQVYFNSAVTGSICAVSLCGLSFLHGRKTLLDRAAPCVFLVGAFLSGQRSAIVCSIFALLLLLSLGFRKGHRMRGMVILLTLLLTMCFVWTHQTQLVDGRVERLSSYNYNRLMRRSAVFDALEERSDRYSFALETVCHHPIGIGVGTTTYDGHVYFGTVFSLCDANFMRILVDSGIIGFASFVGFLLAAAWIFIKRKGQKALFGLCVLMIYTVQALGSAVFDSIYTAQTFWLYMAIAINSPSEEKQ